MHLFDAGKFERQPGDKRQKDRPKRQVRPIHMHAGAQHQHIALFNFCASPAAARRRPIGPELCASPASAVAMRTCL